MRLKSGSAVDSFWPGRRDPGPNAARQRKSNTALRSSSGLCRRDEGAGRAQGARNAEPLVPEACEEQGSDDDANTLSALCRPGLFLGNDDSELFQRERRVLARPVRTNQHRLARLRHHQGASTRPLPVDTGERPLRAPVHTLAKRWPALSPSCGALHDDHSNGGVRCRHLSSSTCQEILEISANAQSKSIEQIVRYFAQR